ncbi:unnamed protein product [Gordionus sp. m RMFG-2023]
MNLAKSNPVEIKNKLLQAFDEQNNIIDMGIVVETISQLEKTLITREDLEQTRLGKYINEIRKKLTIPSDGKTNNAILNDIAKRAKNLVKKWRDDHLKANKHTNHEPDNNNETILGANKTITKNHVVDLIIPKSTQRINGHIKLNINDEITKTAMLQNKNNEFMCEMNKEQIYINHPSPTSKLKCDTSITNGPTHTLVQKSNGYHPDEHRQPKILLKIKKKIRQDPLVKSRKLKTTVELMAEIRAKSEILKDIPISPFVSTSAIIANKFSNQINESVSGGYYNNSLDNRLNTVKAHTAIQSFTKDGKLDYTIGNSQPVVHKKKRGRHKKIKPLPDVDFLDKGINENYSYDKKYNCSTTNLSKTTSPITIVTTNDPFTQSSTSPHTQHSFMVQRIETDSVHDHLRNMKTFESEKILAEETVVSDAAVVIQPHVIPIPRSPGQEFVDFYNGLFGTAAPPDYSNDNDQSLKSIIQRDMNKNETLLESLFDHYNDHSMDVDEPQILRDYKEPHMIPSVEDEKLLVMPYIDLSD